MQDVTAETAKKTAPTRANDNTSSGETTPLVQRYGRIGISAVAAAARYQGDDKNAVSVPQTAKYRNLFGEASA